MPRVTDQEKKTVDSFFSGQALKNWPQNECITGKTAYNDAQISSDIMMKTVQQQFCNICLVWN